MTSSAKATSATDPLVLIASVPHFQTDHVDQALYQLFCNSPTEVATQIPGIGAPDDIEAWRRRTISAVRYEDSLRFPEIRFLTIAQPGLLSIILKICTPQTYDEALVDLLSQNGPQDSTVFRRVLIVVVDGPFQHSPPSGAAIGAEIYTLTLRAIEHKLSLLERIHDVRPSSGTMLSLRARNFLFPYMTALALLVVIGTGVWTSLRGIHASGWPTVAALTLSLAFLAPRLAATIAIYFYSRFREWRPKGWAAGATILEQNKPTMLSIAVSTCPICKESHVLKVQLRWFRVQYRLIPAWLDPFAPSLMSSPRTMRVWVTCPSLSQRFVTTIRIRDSSSLMAVPTTGTDFGDNGVIQPNESETLATNATKTSNADEILWELQKKTVHESLAVGREFAKTMATLSAGFLPVYVATSTFVSRRGQGVPAPLSPLDVLPCAFLILSLVLFVAAYMPRVSKLLLNSPDEWQRALERVFTARRGLMVVGGVCLVVAFALMVVALLRRYHQ